MTGEQKLDEIDAFETGMYSAGGPWQSTEVARGEEQRPWFDSPIRKTFLCCLPMSVPTYQKNLYSETVFFIKICTRR